MTPVTDRYVPAAHAMDVHFGTKVGQIGPKWNKSETFSDQISVHFGLEAKMY